MDRPSYRRQASGIKFRPERFHIHVTRPTPISRVRDLQIDLELLRMTQYTLK